MTREYWQSQCGPEGRLRPLVGFVLILLLVGTALTLASAIAISTPAPDRIEVER